MRLPALATILLSACTGQAPQTPGEPGRSDVRDECAQQEDGTWRPLTFAGSIVGEADRRLGDPEGPLPAWQEESQCREAVDLAGPSTVCAPVENFGITAIAPFSRATGHRIGALELTDSAQNVPGLDACVEMTATESGPIMCAWTGYQGGYLPARVDDGTILGTYIGYIGAMDLCEQQLAGATDAYVCAPVHQDIDPRGEVASGYRAHEIATEKRVGEIFTGVEGIENCNASLHLLQTP